MKLDVAKNLFFKSWLCILMVMAQIPVPARAQMSATMFMPLPGCLASTTVLTYTGGTQTYSVPTGCTSIRVKMWGGGGGGAYYSIAHRNAGGAGAFVTANVAVTSGETLNVIVAGGGGRGLYLGVDDGSATNAGGYGGGGPGGDGTQSGAGGGGYSGIFRGGWAQANALVIAGGGGGAAGYSTVGWGAPANVGTATQCYYNGYSTCFNAGSALTGNTGNPSGGWGGGGGGGGYVGGGGGCQAALCGIGGAAGSSYGSGTGVTKFVIGNGSGANPNATADPNYSAPAGVGGTANPPGNGNNGRVVIVTESSPCTPQTIVYDYTGGNVNLTIPAGCYGASIKAWGGGGGASNVVNAYLSNGGAGAFVTNSNVFTVPGETWVIQVGGGGGRGNLVGAATGSATNAGGWPSGGAGGDGSYAGGGGGGYSGVFRSSATQANALLIAGAGGGGGGYMTDSSGLPAGVAATNQCYFNGYVTCLGGAGSAITGGAGVTYSAYGGGGGGSGYVGGSGGGGDGTTEAFGAAGASSVGGTLTTGSGANPPGTADAYYVSGIAAGGVASTGVANNGGNGRVVISFGSICNLPWGGNCTEGQSYTGYSVTSATSPTLCVNNALASTCQEDTLMSPALSPTYVNQVCTQNCNRPWGGTTASPGTITAYSAASATSPTLCNSLAETRTCQYTTGTFTGSFTNQSCTQNCNRPWGGTTASPGTITAYSNANAYYPTTCASLSQTRTCQYATGTFTGSFTNQSCTQNCSARMGQACTYPTYYWAGAPVSGCFAQCGGNIQAYGAQRYNDGASCTTAFGFSGCASPGIGGWWCMNDIQCYNVNAGTRDCWDNCN